MRKEFSFHNISSLYSRKAVHQALDHCAHDLETQFPEVEQIQIHINTDSVQAHSYEIALRAVSRQSDFMTTIHTRNLFSGLKKIKKAVLHKMRSKKKKRFDRIKRKAKNHDLSFVMKHDDVG